MLNCIGRIVQHQTHDGCNLFEVLLLEATSSSSRSAQTNTTGYKGASRIEGNGILVAGNANSIQQMLCFLTGQVLITHIHQNQMVISATAY